MNNGMRAAVIEGPGRMKVEHVPLPEPGEGQVRVKLEGCGVCASNLTPWEGPDWMKFPTEPGALGNSAHGTATAAITDGVIPGLDMVRAIVLAFGKPSGAPPPGSGSAFKRLGGDFAIQNGTVRTNNLAFTSRDFDMAGRASLVVQTGIR